MVPSPACPTSDILTRLTDADISVDRLEEILQHVEQCGDCTSVVRELQSRRIFNEPKIREAPAENAADSLRLSQLIDLLKRVGPSGEVSTVANSQAISETMIVSPAPVKSEVKRVERYPFLGRPEAEGELGRLGHYIVLQLLGSGGMGMVFEAEDTHLRRRVALKVMQPAQAADHEAKRRFLAEARATAAIEHDHIVVIYQVGEASGVPYLAMQLLRGESLADRLSKSPQLSEHESLRIAKETAEGLAAAHARGLVHRDIKPGNIWLEAKGGRVKVVDFGLVRDLSLDAKMTQSGAIAGTPSFMSPEQVNGQSVDGRTDLFSLGCVLYQMLSGKPPFARENLLRVLNAVCHDEPEPLESARRNISVEVAACVRRLLAKDREARPSSAIEAASELGRLLAKQSPSVNAEPQFNTPNTQAASFRGRGNHPGGWRIAAGAAGFALLCLGLWVSVRQKDGKEVARVSVPEDGTVTVEPAPSSTVQREPAASGSAPSAPSAKPIAELSRLSPEYFVAQRALAVWVVEKGGLIGIDGKPGKGDSAYSSKKPLPATPFRVTSIDLSLIGELTDSELTNLDAARDLEELHLNTKLSEQAIPRLGKLVTLRVLNLKNSGVADHWIQPLAQLSQLRVLGITEGSGLTDAAFEVFEKLTTLTELNLRSGGRFRGRELHRLRNIPGLDTLILEGVDLDDTALPGIGYLTNLGYLDLAGTFTDDGFQHLMSLTKLRRIGLAIRGVGDEKLNEFIRKNRFKDVISLGNSKVTAGIVDSLCEQKQARTINLPSGFPTTGIERIYRELPKVLVQVYNANVPRIPGLTAGDAAPAIAPRPALHFDGIDDYVDITSDWRYDRKPLTFEAWMIPDAVLPDHMSSLLVVENGNASQQNGVMVYRRLQSGGFSIAAPPTTMMTKVLDLCIPGRLVHLAVVWNTAERRVYLNGKRVLGEEKIKNWPSVPSRDAYAWIGATRGGEGHEKSPVIEGWGGKLLGVRMTSRAVYEADFQPAPEFIADKDTVYLYRFDEALGETVRDHSGHNRHGRIVGARWTKTNEYNP